MDYKQYHSEWRDIIRPMILKRDAYKCRTCGLKHKSKVYRKSKGHYQELDQFMENWALDNGKKVFTLYLHIAHINSNKKDNRPENLITLCPYHHAELDKNYKSLKRKIFTKQIDQDKEKSLGKFNTESPAIKQTVKTVIKQFTGVTLSDSQINQILLIIQNT